MILCIPNLSSGADLYLFSDCCSGHAHVTTLHSHAPFDRGPEGRIGDADRYYMDWAPAVPMVALSESARAQEKLPLAFVGVVPNGIAMSQYRSTSKHRGDCLVWLGR